MFKFYFGLDAVVAKICVCNVCKICSKLSLVLPCHFFLDGDFEELEITPVSSPPELPAQMKQQESPVAGS